MKKTEKIFTKEIGWLLKDKYADKSGGALEKDIKRLEKGEPVDYIIGWKPFLNCKIDLLYKPLIPRPETEYWVEKAIKEIKSKDKPLKIADVFSGSGCIGIAILKSSRNIKVDFGDFDDNLIKQIKLNLRLNGIETSQYQVLKSDILNNFKGKYDFIFANPPYIATTRKSKIQKEVLKYEPHLALFGGKDGLNIIRKFLEQAQNYLELDGQIWMEFDSFQKPMIEKILKNSDYKGWKFYKDQYNKWRYAIICG